MSSKKNNNNNSTKPFTFSPPPASSSSSSNNNKPFTFSAPKSSSSSSTATTTSNDNNNNSNNSQPPVPLLEQVRTMFNKQFLKLVNEWKDNHEQSTEHLQQFLSYKHSLQSVSSNSSSSSLEMKQYLKKLEFYHEELVQCITKHLSQLLLEMKNIEQRMKHLVQAHVHSTQQMESLVHDHGSYGFLCSVMDYVRYVTLYVQMHENDFDMKCCVVQALYEEESNFVLNSYLISWKKQPFRNVDLLKGMEMEWNRDEKMRAKLGLPIL